MKQYHPHPRFRVVFGIGTVIVSAELCILHLHSLLSMSMLRDFWSSMQHINLGLACLPLIICGLRVYRYGRIDSFLLMLSSLFVGNCLFALVVRDHTNLYPLLALFLFAVTCITAVRRIPPPERIAPVS